MSTAKISAQLEAEYVARHMHFCKAKCGTPSWVGKEYCGRCLEEIEARERWELECQLKRMDRRERRERWLKTALEVWLVVWDWAKRDAFNWALLIFVAWAVGYILAQYSNMWAQWLLDLAKG
jgi:hypothetical protein